MEYRITHTRTGDHRLYYHFGWTTGYNRRVLNDVIAALILSEAPKIAEANGFWVEDVKVIDESFVEVVTSAPPTIAPTEMITKLKGQLGRKITNQFPDIKSRCYQQKIWNRSYYIESIGYFTQKTFRYYRQNQERGKNPSLDLKTGKPLDDTLISRVYDYNKKNSVEE